MRDILETNPELKNLPDLKERIRDVAKEFAKHQLPDGSVALEMPHWLGVWQKRPTAP